MKYQAPGLVLLAALLWLIGSAAARRPRPAQEPARPSRLDQTVEAFLAGEAGHWHDLNVPEADGRFLFNLVLEHRYTRALEIGTSTGRSGIWIAWALSRTGGRLITIEIDRRRHLRAVENFRRAGLSGYIDARRADAHDLVAELPGPFDFVFCDADKEWYKDYLRLVWPKVEPGGCFAAHNALSWMPGIKEFLDSARKLPDGRTTIDRSSSSGISLTFRRPRK
jgi:caffeoyl-CoA O-methyltransferase